MFDLSSQNRKERKMSQRQRVVDGKAQYTALYDGSELFGREIPQKEPQRDPDPFERVVKEQMKTYGDQDGRHKRQ